MCEALLEAGAKIDETDYDGKSALMLAAQEGHTLLVERLLEQHGAPIDQHALDGKTGLRYYTIMIYFTLLPTLYCYDIEGDALVTVRLRKKVKFFDLRVLIVYIDFIYCSLPLIISFLFSKNYLYNFLVFSIPSNSSAARSFSALNLLFFSFKTFFMKARTV